MNKVTIKSVEDCKHSTRADKDKMVCGLCIPNWLLAEWRDDDGSDSYIEKLNYSVVGHAMQVKPTSERIEGRLQRQAGSVVSDIKRSTK